MKTVDTILAVLSWIILGVILHALSPLLIKLIDMADHLNRFFGE